MSPQAEQAIPNLIDGQKGRKRDIANGYSPSREELTMADEFYVECFLHRTDGSTKLGELACSRDAASRQALADSLVSIYREEDQNRIRLCLRKATPSDSAEVADILRSRGHQTLEAAWADATVRLASGNQNTQFNEEDCAPSEWVEAVESARIGSARWRDASWGNNAAPSWELFDGNQVLAEAFFYTTQNGERFTRLYDTEPYLEVVLLDEDSDITGGFQTSPDTFLRILEAAGGYGGPARAAFRNAAQVACDEGRALWSQSD